MRSTGSTESQRLIAAVRGGLYEVVEEGQHFAIYDLGVKTYPPTTFLVQSSGQPIDLGEEMVPLMDTTELWAFVKAHDIPLQNDARVEVYLYNWVDRAQGPMIFDVGVAIADDTPDIDEASGFEIKRYPAMKFASLVYEGPFPHQENSGWDRIRWEDRAKDNGFVYTERLYRELYHRVDYETHRHVTEVQIEIE